MSDVFRRERGLAMCGLACALCSDSACVGCHNQGCEKTDCDVMQCVRERGLDGCYACEDFPCDKGMLKGVRIRAFNRYARGRGKTALLERLEANAAAGIVYHRPGGLQGDYDALSNERDIMYLLQFGREPNPFAECPTYETPHFALRLVRPEDAGDLLACYGDPAARPLFDDEGCNTDFAFDTEQEVANYIGFWLKEYENGIYIRFAIVEKESGLAVGTAEVFERLGERGEAEPGLLRLDIASRYEKENDLRELLDVCLRCYRSMHTEKIAIKAPPVAAERIAALTSRGFTSMDDPEWAGYYQIAL